MTVRLESQGEVLQCNGCGRTSIDAGVSLPVEAFVVHDPNVGSAVTHHYCAGCAENRGSVGQERLEFGWSAAPTPAFAPNETDEQRQAREAARGPIIPGSGEDTLSE